MQHSGPRRATPAASSIRGCALDTTRPGACTCDVLHARTAARRGWPPEPPPRCSSCPPAPAAAGDGGGASALPSDSLDANADLKAQSLVVSNWAGYMPEDLPTQFEAAVGPKVTVTNHATNEEIMAKLTAGGDSGIDVAFVSGQFAQALAEHGLARADRPRPDPQPGEPLPRGDAARATTRATSTPCPTRGAPPASATAATSSTRRRRAGTTCSTPTPDVDGQDHHAGHRALADAAGAEGARLLGQHDRRRTSWPRSRTC